MKRFGLFAVVAVVLAVGISFALRRGVTPVSTSAVAELLPRDTVAVVHVPDLNRMRDEWRGTDLYKLYREPAVQDFLHKPLSQAPKADAARDSVRDVEQLGIKDGFFALTTLGSDNHSFVAGFRYRGTEHDAESVIGKWRAHIAGGQTARQTVDYNQHRIEVSGSGIGLVATACDRDWYFAGNDVDQLKALLDRADHRQSGTPAAETLQEDENFKAATSHMPGNYVAMLYVQPKGLSDRMAAWNARATGAASPPQNLFENVHAVCGAMQFDGGKIRDIWFVETPKRTGDRMLKRSAVSLGTPDTFLYVASLLNANGFAALGRIGNGMPGAGWLRKVLDVAARQGVTAADWSAAFDLELGSLADWPADAHWPSLIASLPVKDRARAEKIVNALPAAIDEDGAWIKTEKDGVRYFAMQNQVSWFAIAPTIALSDKLLVLGVDARSVEEAIKRGHAGGAGLAQVAAYKSAARVLPEPTTAYIYVDLPALYARLDASLRPMLMMAAMFMPAISGHVDLSKLPPPEIVTKHLSPVVCSQRYEKDGYITESTGPVTATQLTLTVGVPALWWFNRSH